jgi:predicted MFS family arabinose efflux permease
VCSVFLIANAAFSSMPVFYGAYLSELHLRISVAGFVSTAETTGLAIGSTFSIYLFSRRGIDLRRLVIFWLAILLLAQIGSAYFRDPAAFAVSRGLSGVCTGAVQSAGAAWISRFRNSERPFALYTAMSFLGGTLGIPAFSLVDRHFGLSGSYLVFSGLVAVAMLLSVAYPALSAQSASAAAPSKPSPPVRHEALLLGSIVGNFAFNGGVWVYLEEAGRHAMINLARISLVLSAGMFVALAVSIAIAVAKGGTRRFSLLMLAHGCLVVSTLLIVLLPTLRGFSIGVVLFHVGIAMVSPYFLALLADKDHTGHAAVRGIAAMNVGYSIGPWLLSLLVASAGYDLTMQLAACAFACCAILVALACLGRSRAGLTEY